MELPTTYQTFIHKSRYARWNDNLKRRENWNETVERYFNFFKSHLKKLHSFDITDIQKQLQEAILNLEVMPSMRCLMTAGPALEHDNICGYNCAYTPVDNIHTFDEIMYILMNGTGIGFSVERQYINLLPSIPENLEHSLTIIKVEDSKLGWASSYRELIALLYAGKIPKFDVSLVRPRGAKLKTFGGRASGPEPLLELFEFTIQIFKESKGRKLNSLEVHDIVCKIASIVVVGGVRRSALISLSNLSDQRMQQAKTGQWWTMNPQRALANNSVCYTEKPDILIFMKEWMSLIESQSGERGIFNRVAAKNTVKKLGDRRSLDHDFGCNPCSEILLRPKEFCNLTEVIIRQTDNLETLKYKVKVASILGTFQSTLVNFKYISNKWSENCKEEALLGVSLTGIMDNEIMSGQLGTEILIHTLKELRNVAIETNFEWAKKLQISPSAAITCVKPSGTVSQLVDSASGIHTRHSKYYIRTVRISKTDPIGQFLIDNKFPHETDFYNPEAYVFSFPMKAPENAITREQQTALQQLQIWQIYQDHWCEHKPSITVTIKPHEWLNVADFVYTNFDNISGISFLPHSEHTYKQAPYQECNEEFYLDFLSKMPNNIDWNELASRELDDNTTSSQELACAGGSCEL